MYWASWADTISALSECHPGSFATMLLLLRDVDALDAPPSARQAEQSAQWLRRSPSADQEADGGHHARTEGLATRCWRRSGQVRPQAGDGASVALLGCSCPSALARVLTGSKVRSACCARGRHSRTMQPGCWAGVEGGQGGPFAKATTCPATSFGVP